jgi:hypothetical protein
MSKYGYSAEHLSYINMRNFLKSWGFHEKTANYITNYTITFKIVDVLQLRDFETIIPEANLSLFWPRLKGAGKNRLKMVIAWAKEEYDTRLELGTASEWDGNARVDILKFEQAWFRNIRADYKVRNFKFE